MTRDARKRDKSAGRARLRKNKSARYPIESSPLWKLSSIHQLAVLIGIPVDELEATCMAPTYHRFDEASKDGKEPRHIQEPTGATLRAHYRLVRHLDSIQRPDFLHSATKKRSHITNARAHAESGGAVVAMDIRKFFESTMYQHVKSFFHKDLGCSHDIARFLANICTADGHLPTGSCISPLLSYFTHRHLFADIERLCAERGVTMTLYVDDLTLSGPHATKGLLFETKVMIKRCGLRTKDAKDAVVRPGKAAIITGVVRRDGGVRLRNKHHGAIVAIQDSIATAGDNNRDVLRGRLAAARAVEPSAAARLEERLTRMMTRKSVNESLK
ncbi:MULTISPECIES: reverse transcriptase family protein [Burkholderia]|uniref:reverse transcriptase family protein n=1 Tax=Burkholderia TaxID=32008 RepID=UPI0009B58701|nr:MULTISPECIES: reverse transcriptase family protein [Burkholderia]RQM58075.1 RNA-directed DNA polymerase [Burkholderia vietnamiensis]